MADSSIGNGATATPDRFVSQRDLELRFFSTITRFGTPRDVTIDELRIEYTFADEPTAQLCRALAQTIAAEMAARKT